MMDISSVPREEAPDGAEFGVVITDDTMEPFVKEGSPVFAARPDALAPGDVGIFLIDGRLICRQYLEDSEGTAYLFTLNRSRRDFDLALPASEVVLFARVLLPSPVPLPGVKDGYGASDTNP